MNKPRGLGIVTKTAVRPYGFSNLGVLKHGNVLTKTKTSNFCLAHTAVSPQSMLSADDNHQLDHVLHGSLPLRGRAYVYTFARHEWPVRAAEPGGANREPLKGSGCGELQPHPAEPRGTRTWLMVVCCCCCFGCSWRRNGRCPQPMQMSYVVQRSITLQW
jgi:hypothetical protein